ncbi:TLD-domain-containing protein, partial [Saccharata proteae CBS 121410]
SSSFFTYPVSYAVSGILRRISTDPSLASSKRASSSTSQPFDISTSSPFNGMQGVYTPPGRHASPFQPPPLTPLSLNGYRSETRDEHKLLSRQVAEEVRLLVPPRLQLSETWNLTYSLMEDGMSLATLYRKASELRGKRGGYVLVVQDANEDIFGAYLSDPPHPQSGYYGTGECFLWRAHVLPPLPPNAIPSLDDLPPPPSADTTNVQRTTTLQQPKRRSSQTLSPPNSNGVSRSGTTTPEQIRFRAFPYSGANEYMILGGSESLGMGGGDGHYGLWLDKGLSDGVSDPCPSFGNESLSDLGSKFKVIGVELWHI